jgi:hypothetical protein
MAKPKFLTLHMAEVYLIELKTAVPACNKMHRITIKNTAIGNSTIFKGRYDKLPL